MEIRPFSSRQGSERHLCTVIDFANAKAARAVGLPADAHVFQINDLVVLADGAQGRIVEFKAHMAMVALAGARCGIRRAAALSTMRRIEEGHP